MCRVLVANPLVARMPRLVFCLLATCNKFDIALLEKNWAQIHEFLRDILEASIGPLVGYGSDGDSRKRWLMFDGMSKGSYGLDVESSLMKFELR